MFIFKGRLRATIFKSAEAVHLILLCHLGDAIRCAVSADLKIVTRNRPLFIFMLLIFNASFFTNQTLIP